MSLSLENLNDIMSDETFPFDINELKKYPTVDQIDNYKKLHPNYAGKLVNLWTLYFEIIQHLAIEKITNSSEEQEIMKKSSKQNIWIKNELHDVKYISLLFTILMILMENYTGQQFQSNGFLDDDLQVLTKYVSLYLPIQIQNILADKQKIGLFGKYNIKNLTTQNKKLLQTMVLK